jgi:murein DD-endopeptidase MepM/ murein hydrolase activator NlpD
MLGGFGEPVAYQDCGFHTGQDWFAPPGTPIFATADGLVVYVGPLWLDGPGSGRGPQAIVLDHGAYYTTYSHNRSAEVRPGQSVEAGERLGESGDEGYSVLPHLHFEKVVGPWTGDWRRPFEGCDVYADPGAEWRWF